MRALILLAALSACSPATTQYVPQVTADDELVLSYDGRFAVWRRGELVARGLGFAGLAHHVRCVPAAHERAVVAESAGKRALAFSIVGGVLGGISLGAFAAFASPRQDVRVGVLLGGVGLAAIGTLFAALGYKDKNVANGSAVDAMNFYNDAAGSTGASCDHPASAPTSEPTSQPASAP